MTRDLAAAAKLLVAGDSPVHVAASAVRACQQLTYHLTRIIGEGGSRTLLARSVLLTSARIPWLTNTIPPTAPADELWTSLRGVLELQDPDTARDAFAELVSTFVELLGRLIGEGLVARLLPEVWPEIFSSAEKETM